MTSQDPPSLWDDLGVLKYLRIPKAPHRPDNHQRARVTLYIQQPSDSSGHDARTALFGCRVDVQNFLGSGYDIECGPRGSSYIKILQPSGQSPDEWLEVVEKLTRRCSAVSVIRAKVVQLRTYDNRPATTIVIEVPYGDPWVDGDVLTFDGYEPLEYSCKDLRMVDGNFGNIVLDPSSPTTSPVFHIGLLRPTADRAALRGTVGRIAAHMNMVVDGQVVIEADHVHEVHLPTAPYDMTTASPE